MVEVVDWHGNGDILWNSESIDDSGSVAVAVCPGEQKELNVIIGNLCVCAFVYVCNRLAN